MIAKPGPDQVIAKESRSPLVGIGFRNPIAEWTLNNLDQFDVLEITVDHCISSGDRVRQSAFDFIGRVPLTAHGIGLSIGTDAPLDLDYLDRVADVIECLGAPFYSEHLAFTRVPGRDMANLLPLPRTEAVAGDIIEKVRVVQERIPVPFLLENISYLFDWPDSVMTEGQFFNLVCGETGAGILLDVENLYVNSRNHDFDPYAFLDNLPARVVKEVHVAGGVTVTEAFLDRPVLADTHSHPAPDEALDLLGYALVRQSPETIVLERDERETLGPEILDDVARIRRCVSGAKIVTSHVEPANS